MRCLGFVLVRRWQHGRRFQWRVAAGRDDPGGWLAPRSHPGGPGLQCEALDQDLTAVQLFQVVAKRLEFGAQQLQVVLPFLLDLAPQVHLELQLVLAPSGDLALQLDLVDGLQVGRLVLAFACLPPISDGQEDREYGRPECGQHTKA